MGWSCAAAAGLRLSAISDWVYMHGGLKNADSWRDPKTGQRYFFEASNREHRDGAITGAIHRFVSDTHCIKSGTFRIEPDGRRMRGPAILKAVKAYEVEIDGRSHREWQVSRLGEPNDHNLWCYVWNHGKSFEKGGRNQRVSESLGYVPYPNKARIVCLNDGDTVAEWKAAMFQTWSGPAPEREAKAG